MDRRTGPKQAFQRLASPVARKMALLLLIVAAFALGGGSRGDINSLILLRPLAFALLAYVIAVGNWDDVSRNGRVALFAVAVLTIVVLHLVPLPPAAWQSLPGRDIVVRGDTMVGLGAIARPLALNVTEATNSLLSLSVPAAVLGLIAIQRTDWRSSMLVTLLGLGAVSIVFAFLQVLGPPDGPFYTYRITNASSPVGLFANRNHNAVFLAMLLPALAVFGAGGRAPERGQRDRRPLRRATSWVGAVLALIFVLASGSRAGLVLAAVAIGSVPFVLGASARELLFSAAPAAKMGNSNGSPFGAAIVRYWRATAVAVFGVGLALLAAFGRFESSVARFASEGDNRTEMWAATLPLIGKYFPWGSGAGSFVDVFRRDEPYALLGPRYVNHAHNDVLEVALTFGLPGILLMAIFLFFLARRVIALWPSRRDQSFAARIARLGLILLMLSSLASVVDYPLRTPAMMALFVVAATWLIGESRSELAAVPRRVKRADP